MIAIFRKELRDILRWTPLGMIVIGLLCWQNVPYDVSQFSGRGPDITFSIIVGSSLFAIGLGFLQSFFDLRSDTRGFLLHRPVTSSHVFWGKIAAAFAVHTLAWSIPVLVSAAYLESMGPEHLPVTWSYMLVPAVCCMVSFLFHPAAMWVACRDARWIGSRCFPMALPLVACGASMVLEHPGEPAHWIMLGSGTMIAAVAYIVVTAAKHAFTRQTYLPAPASADSMSSSNTIGLTVASTVAFVMTIFFLQTFMPAEGPGKPTTQRTALSTDGQLWEVEETWALPRTWQDKPVSRRGRLLTGDNGGNESFTPLDESWNERTLLALNEPRGTSSSFISGRYRWITSSPTQEYGQLLYLFHKGGRLYAYNNRNRWVGTVTPEGIFAPDETPQGTFSNVHCLQSSHSTGVPWFSLGGHPLLADDNGVYQLNYDAGQIRRLADSPTQAMAITLSSDKSPQTILWTKGDRKIRRFTCLPLTDNETLPSADSELVKATHSYPLANIKMTPTGEWPIDWIHEFKNASLSVSSASDKGVVMQISGPFQHPVCRFGQADGSLNEAISLPDHAAPTAYNDFLLGEIAVPPAILAGWLAVVMTIYPDVNWLETIPGFLPILLVFLAFIAGSGAMFLTHYHDRSKKEQIAWLVTGVLLGFSSWIAISAIYRRPVKEKCTKCDRKRRVDLDRCEHCGAEWEAQENEGIELIGLRDIQPVAV